MNSEILNAVDEATRWMQYDGVEGVAQGEKDGKTCITVFVSCPPSELATEIPATFEGFPVVFKESGLLSAQ